MTRQNHERMQSEYNLANTHTNLPTTEIYQDDSENTHHLKTK